MTSRDAHRCCEALRSAILATARLLAPIAVRQKKGLFNSDRWPGERSDLAQRAQPRHGRAEHNRDDAF